MTARRVGVFGGTFDPVHLGHLIGAEEACGVLGLDRILFVPAHHPPHKLDEPITPDEHRLAMLELALAGNPRFEISRVDLDRPGASFTVDTLGLLQAELGAEVALHEVALQEVALHEVALHFVMGMDSLVELPTWHRPDEIIRRARLAVLNRPGYEPDWTALEAAVPGLRNAVDWVPTPYVGISATDIRRRVAEGRPIRYQVPDAVVHYIHAHGLYVDADHSPPRPPNSGGRGVAGAHAPPDPAITRLLVATSNPGKRREYRTLLVELPIAVVSPAEVDLVLDVPETADTYEGNALLKARAYAQASGLPTLADDSGLDVDALGGFPGVHSARWVPGSDGDRVAALLARLSGVPMPERTARFRAAVVLAWPDGRTAVGHGQVEGRIADAPRGSGGFGYDPIFLVEDGGYDGQLTMAELPSAEKDRLSHRGRAVRALWPALTSCVLPPLQAAEGL